MPRIDLPFIVEKQHITQPTREVLISGGRNYFYATFIINELWEDVRNLKAVFVTEAVSKLISLTKTENGFECKIPWEVMNNKGAFQVGIFGGDRLLTDYAYVVVRQGCVTEGEVPKPPTEDWFTKIEGQISDLAENGGGVSGDYCTETQMMGYVDEQTSTLRNDIEGLQQQINEESHFRGYLSTNAKIQALEATPNDFAYSAESGTKWVYDATDGWQDTGTPVPDQLTPASNATPLANGEPSPGQSEEYARGDHRHPTDTTRASVEELNALRKNLAKDEDVVHKEGYEDIRGRKTFYDGLITHEVFWDGTLRLKTSWGNDIHIAEEGVKVYVNNPNKQGNGFFLNDKEVALKEDITTAIGDIETAFDELHAYAQALVTGGGGE